jgi:hypothetical protein
MHFRLLGRTGALLVVALVALAGLGEASTVLRFSNEELARRADVILLGKCTAMTARAGDGPVIFTEYTFDVAEFVKGAPVGSSSKTFQFKALGGKLEDRGWVISGSATYGQDEECLVFLDAPHPKTGARHAIGLAQGKFSVKVESGTNKKYLVRDLGGLRVVDSVGKPVDTKDGPRLYLDTFLKEIKGYLEKK